MNCHSLRPRLREHNTCEETSILSGIFGKQITSKLRFTLPFDCESGIPSSWLSFVCSLNESQEGLKRINEDMSDWGDESGFRVKWFAPHVTSPVLGHTRFEGSMIESDKSHAYPVCPRKFSFLFAVFAHNIKLDKRNCLRRSIVLFSLRKRLDSHSIW